MIDAGTFEHELPTLREIDTRAIIETGQAAKLLDLVEWCHPVAPERLPRETASFLITHVLHAGQEKAALEIYHQPYVTDKTPTSITALYGTRWFVEAETQSSQIDDVVLDLVREVAIHRPILINPPLFSSK